MEHKISDEMVEIISQIRDEGDLAQVLDLQEQHATQERARHMNIGETHPDFDGKHCIDCTEVIPARRLAMGGKIRCVACQEYHERHQARR